VNGPGPTSDYKCKSHVEVTYDHHILRFVAVPPNIFRLLGHKYDGRKVATIDSLYAILKVWPKLGLQSLG
jgi:uncharacterized membrane protein YGL010W